MQSVTSLTSQIELMKPFHSSRASALGTCEGRSRRREKGVKSAEFHPTLKEKRDYSDLFPHSELDAFILQLEVESGCLQVSILAVVVRY